MSPNNPFLRSHDPADPAIQGDRNIGQDLDNIFRLTAAQAAPARARAAATETRRVTQGELDAALDMLNRAAKAMDLMQARYQQVEDYAKGVAERAEKDVAAAYAQARDWEMRAAGSEGKLEDLRNRAEAAERRVEAAERDAREARDWLEAFYDRIVNSFDTRSLLKSQAA